MPLTEQAPSFPPEATQVRCQQCGATFTGTVQTVVDARDEQARRALLAGQLNVVRCPSCGGPTRALAPVLYHDPTDDVAYVWVPSALGLGHEEQEQAIGQLTNRVLEQLPAEERRMYLLQPRTFLTEQAFMEAVLEAQGIDRKELEQAQRLTGLVERLLEAPDADAVRARLEAAEQAVDRRLISVVDALAQQARAAGNSARGGQLEALRDQLVEMAGGVQMTADELIEELLAARADDALDDAVAAYRPVLDYGFFAELTARMEAADDEAEAERLRALRKDVVDAVDRLDEDVQAEIEQAVELLRTLLSAPDPVSALSEHRESLNEAFFLVLRANIEAAQQDGQAAVVSQLQAIQAAAVEAIESQMPPLARLVNRLARAEDRAARNALLDASPELIGEELEGALRGSAANARAAGAAPVADALEASADLVAERRTGGPQGIVT